MIQPELFAGGSKQFILITSLYNEKNPERHAEYLHSLQKNVENPLIKKIHAYYDISNDTRIIKNSKILSFLKQKSLGITFTNKRPTFSQIFELANSKYPGEDIIISNGDIYFDETLARLNGFDLNNKFIALSKWDILPNGQLESHPWYDPPGEPSWGSQDAWIFHTPIKDFDKARTALGTAYCDGYIAYYAYLEGYRVFNPCLSIIAHHVHSSGIRNWKHVLATELCLRVPWCTLDNLIYPTNNEIMDFSSPPQPNRAHKHRKNRHTISEL